MKDLAGLRVLVFPSNLMGEVDKVISNTLGKWKPDHIYYEDDSQKILAKKYYGYIDENEKIYCEYQIVPMLIGLFWHVEHSALYKPSQRLKKLIELDYAIRVKRETIYKAFNDFEDKFDQIRNAAEPMNNEISQ